MSIEKPEDRANRILHAAIGIHGEARISRPDIPNGHWHSEFTATRLRLRCFEQSSTQRGELEFAHRPLESKQQSVVRRTRIVDTIRIDHPRFHQSAQLQQVMPVPTVASQTRCLEAKYGTDNALADLPDQLSKTWAIHRAARGDAEVVVYDRNIAEPVFASELCELVLAASALEILCNLNARRLTNVDERTPSNYTLR